MDSEFGSRIVAIAEKWLGVPYELGGDGVTTTDCSKLTLDVFREAGVDLLERDADEQYHLCQERSAVFSDDELAQPGDLVFFFNTYGDWPPGTVTHVGIYAGDGMMIHAGDPVQYTAVWKSDFAGYGRPYAIGV